MKKMAIASVVLSMSAHAGLHLSKSQGPEVVPGEILVKFKAGKRGQWLLSKKALGSEKESFDVSFGEFSRIVISEKSDMNQVLEALNNDPSVEYAEPNFIYRAIDFKASAPEFEYFTRNATQDPKFGDLWGLVNTGANEPAGSRGNSSSSGVAGADINALAAWDITKGSSDVRIAVIDTGVDYNHPDLKNNMYTNYAELNGEPGVDDDGNGYVDDIHGYDFANNDGDPMDGNGHGTHCSGTIAAEHDNGVGIAGVMAHAKIVAVKFLTDQGSGSTADAVKAVDYATKMNVDLMSNSWGGGGASQALKEAIEAAKDAGIVFTAAAGNSATNNDTKPHYPSNYDVENVISVAAHNYNDGLASFSCYGAQTVHVAAPGRNILSTTPNNSYAVYSGTSMATPHVSGVVGLYIARYGRTDVTELRNTLMSSSVYGDAYGRKTIGGGRVDAYNFLQRIDAPRPAQPDPSQWVSYPVSWESAHPYANNANISQSFTVPGAKFVRVVVKEYDIESGYDFLHIQNADGQTMESLSGQGAAYESMYVRGDTVNLNFTSDGSETKFGFVIEEIQYVP